MTLLKEDIERINNLPIEEYMEVVGNFTQEEYKEFFAKQSLNEGKESFRTVMFEGSIEEDTERMGAINADNFLNEMREKYGLAK